MKEIDLAKIVIDFLEDQRWEVFQEVQFRGSIADIVARQGPIVWIIECKTSQSMVVMEQAWKWYNHAHYVSIAIPGKHQRGHEFADKVLRNFGIGKLQQSQRDTIFEHIAPKLNRRPFDSIVDALHEAQKNFANAGSSGGRRWSPWKETCATIAHYVKKNPGTPLKEVMDNCKHHYRGSSTARSCIAKWGKKGVIEGVEFRQQGRNLLLFPKP